MDEFDERGINMATEDEFVGLTGKCERVEPMSGNRRDREHGDPLDAAIFSIDPERVTDDMRQWALTVRDVDVSDVGHHGRPTVLLGYPANRVKSDSKTLTPNWYDYLLADADDATYLEAGVRRNTHVVMPFDRDRLRDPQGQPRAGPRLQGMSGCGVWRFAGRDRLVAIFTGQPRSSDFLLATRVALHIELIRRQHPELTQSLPRSRTLPITFRDPPSSQRNGEA